MHTCCSDEGCLTLDAEEVKNDDAKIIKIIEVRTKDRIAFPKEVRGALDIKQGDWLAFVEEPNKKIWVKKVKPEFIEVER